MNPTLPPPSGPMITALIVDDERPARARIRQLLLAHRTVVVIGEAGSVDQAVAAIGEHRPDVIFLDIHMKPRSGFELLAELPQTGPPIHIVFVTAFDEHAVRAFEENALDYLTKPVRTERLGRSIDRLSRLLAQSGGAMSPVPADRHDQGAITPLDIVLLKNGPQTRMVQAASIRSVQARGHACVLRLKGGEAFEINGTISGWAKRLPADLFVRLSRKLLVNRSQVARLTAIDRNRSQLFLQGDQKPLVISRLEASRLKKAV
jgi:two-component system, LytTR family, response regulator